MCSLYYRGLTVDYGDVSVLVILWQCDGRPRNGGNCSDRPAAVSAVNVVCCHPCLIASTSPSSPSAQPASSQANIQTVGVAEWIPCTVATVRLVNPLHHRGLSRHTVVLARQDHWLEQHGILLLISHKDMNPWATRREDNCGRMRR